uniref:Uncharacterized protein n=1 Tax=Oryza nivara TaxID=4536 RepID=A0A0E0G5Z8_ORYNI
MKLVFPDEFARPVKNRYRSQLTSFSGPSKKYCSLSVKNKKKKKKCCSTAEITKHSVRILSPNLQDYMVCRNGETNWTAATENGESMTKILSTASFVDRAWVIAMRWRVSKKVKCNSICDAFILEVGGMATITVPVPGDEVLRTSNARRFFYSSTEASIGLTQCWISSLAVHATRLAFTVP